MKKEVFMNKRIRLALRTELKRFREDLFKDLIASMGHNPDAEQVCNVTLEFETVDKAAIPPLALSGTDISDSPDSGKGKGGAK